MIFSRQSIENPEMKKAIFKGAKIGAIIGFVLALLYAIIVLMVAESHLPIPNPSTNVFFTPDFFDVEFPFLLTASPIWLLIPVLIGSITAGCFAFIISKFQPSRKRTIFICLLSSTIVALPLLILYTFMSIAIATGGIYHSMLEPILEIKLLLLFPSIIYIFAAIFTGQYLYNRLPPSIINVSSTTS